MIPELTAIIAAYLIGSIPVAWAAGRASGTDLRERGSGNIGANNVFQSAARWMIVPVGLAQIAQGMAAVLLGRLLGDGEALVASCGVAALVANNWNPWLRFAGGRGNGIHIGVLLVLSPWALAAFVSVALAGVALRAAPQGVAVAMIAAPIAAGAAGDGAAVIAGCAALAIAAFAKRLLGNGPPDATRPRPAVWMLRLAYDRDIRDREEWVRGSREARA